MKRSTGLSHVCVRNRCVCVCVCVCVCTCEGVYVRVSVNVQERIMVYLAYHKQLNARLCATRMGGVSAHEILAHTCEQKY